MQTILGLRKSPQAEILARKAILCRCEDHSALAQAQVLDTSAGVDYQL